MVKTRLLPSAHRLGDVNNASSLSLVVLTLGKLMNTSNVAVSALSPMVETRLLTSAHRLGDVNNA